MSVISEEFFQKILNNLSELYGIAVFGSVTEPGYSQVKNRASLVFALEVLLERHREKHGTLWSPLPGKLALLHLILQKYKWPLSEIKALTLQESVFLLQEELKFENLPDLAQRVLKNYLADRAEHYFAEIREEEWDPDLYLTIPKPQRW